MRTFVALCATRIPHLGRDRLRCRRSEAGPSRVYSGSRTVSSRRSRRPRLTRRRLRRRSRRRRSLGSTGRSGSHRGVAASREVALGRLEPLLDALAALDHGTRRLVDGVTLLVLVLGPASTDAPPPRRRRHPPPRWTQRILGRLFDHRHAPTIPARQRGESLSGRSVPYTTRSNPRVLWRPSSVSPSFSATRMELLVRRIDQADDVACAQLVVRPCARGARRLGRIALAPVLARDRPADLDRRPVRRVVEPGAAHELARVALLEHPVAEALERPVSRHDAPCRRHASCGVRPVCVARARAPTSGSARIFAQGS